MDLIADYTEYLVANALELQLASKSSTSYDAEDAQGKRYEIKGRRLTAANPNRGLSAIRGLDQRYFTYLVGVLFNEDFSINRGCLVPVDIAQQVGVYRQHVNGWILYLRGH